MIPASASSSSGIGSAISNVGSAALDFAADTFGFNRSRDASSKEAKRNRAFQLYMANTAYQRAAKDLDKAGLNRVLALGSPAATPSGAGFTAPNSRPDPIGAASAKQAISQSRAQERLLDSQAKLTEAQAAEANVKKSFWIAIEPMVKKFFQDFNPNMPGGSFTPRDLIPNVKGAIEIDSPKAKVPEHLSAKGQKGKSPEEVRAATTEHMKNMSATEKLQFMWNMILENF